MRNVSNTLKIIGLCVLALSASTPDAAHAKKHKHRDASCGKDYTDDYQREQGATSSCQTYKKRLTEAAKAQREYVKLSREFKTLAPFCVQVAGNDQAVFEQSNWPSTLRNPDDVKKFDILNDPRKSVALKDSGNLKSQHFFGFC